MNIHLHILSAGSCKKINLNAGIAFSFENGEAIFRIFNDSWHIIMRRWTALFFQTAVTIGLLCWLLHDGGFRQKLLTVFIHSDIRWVAAGIGACGILNILGVFRWRIFLEALDISIPFWQCVQLYFIGAFFNLFLIGMVGGDAVKAGCLIAEGHKKTSALFSVLLDRISGFGALLVSATALIVIRYKWLTQSPIVAGMVYFIFVFLGVALILLSSSLLISIWNLQDRLPQGIPFRKMLIDTSDAYAVFLRKWKGSLAACLLSFVMLFSFFFAFYCSSRSIGEKIGLLDFFSLMPVVDIITALPISVGGIGVREQLFETLLGQLCGVAIASAFIISMGGFLFNAVWCFLGAGFLPFYHGLIKNAEKATL